MLFNVYGAEKTSLPIHALDPPKSNVDRRSIVAFSGMGTSLNCAKLGDEPFAPSASDLYIVSLRTQPDNKAAAKKITENNVFFIFRLPKTISFHFKTGILKTA